MLILKGVAADLFRNRGTASPGNIDTDAGESAAGLEERYFCKHRYFYGPVETLDDLNFKEETKMFDICAVGPFQ